jgi:hypothetical protein
VREAAQALEAEADGVQREEEASLGRQRELDAQ